MSIGKMMDRSLSPRRNQVLEELASMFEDA
jgi:hypothetical protein